MSAFDPSGGAIFGQGWSGIPGVVTTANGTQAGGFGVGASFGTGDTQGDGGSVGGGAGADVTPGLDTGLARAVDAVTHPTLRQALFFLAVLGLAYAWRGHLRSMLE